MLSTAPLGSLQVHADREQRLDHPIVQLLGDPLSILEHGQSVQSHLGLFSLRRVPQSGDDHHAAVGLQRTERDVRRKFRAVFAPQIDVEVDAHRPCPWVGHVAAPVFRMKLAEALRDEELDQLPEELSTRVTGERFEQAIRVRDLPTRVHKHHRVGQCLKEMLNGHRGSPLLRRRFSSVDPLMRASRWTLGSGTGLRHRGRRYLSAYRLRGAGLDGPEHRGTIDSAIARVSAVMSEQHVPPCLRRTPPSDHQGRGGPAPHTGGVDSRACLIGRGTW